MNPFIVRDAVLYANKEKKTIAITYPTARIDVNPVNIKDINLLDSSITIKYDNGDLFIIATEKIINISVGESISSKQQRDNS